MPFFLILFPSYFPLVECLALLLLFLEKSKVWQRWATTLSHDPTAARPGLNSLSTETDLNLACWCSRYLFRVVSHQGSWEWSQNRAGVLYWRLIAKAHLHVIKIPSWEHNPAPDLMEIGWSSCILNKDDDNSLRGVLLSNYAHFELK